MQTWELLEHRWLFSDLFYGGSGDDDTYTVRLKAGDATKLEVVESLGGGSPVTHTSNLADVDVLTIETGGGFDLLTVDETNGPIPIPFGIEYDAGGDFDEIVWHAGGGNDTVEIYNGAIIVGVSDIEFANNEDFTINGNGGADTILVDTIDPDTGWTINGGSGNDALDIYAGDLDVIEGEITFNAGADTDSINIDDSFNTFSDDYTITATTLTRDFYSGFTYSGAESLVLTAQQGGNNIFLAGTAAATPVTINGGDGNDSLYITAPEQSNVQFNGGLDPADTDSIYINAGTHIFSEDANLGTAHLAVAVNGAGSSAVFDTSQHLKSLTIAGGLASVTTQASLRLTTETISINGGQLDLNNNDLHVTNDVVGVWTGSDYTGISKLVRDGRAGGDWSGSGIVTSMPDAIAPDFLTTLGVASAVDVLGLPGVFVKYTYGGDANLSGRIDADDYFYLDSSYNDPGNAALYAKGDFNYDGLIDGDDFFIIDQNFSDLGPNPPVL